MFVVIVIFLLLFLAQSSHAAVKQHWPYNKLEKKNFLKIFSPFCYITDIPTSFNWSIIRFEPFLMYSSMNLCVCSFVKLWDLFCQNLLFVLEIVMTLGQSKDMVHYEAERTKKVLAYNFALSSASQVCILIPASLLPQWPGLSRR